MVYPIKLVNEDPSSTGSTASLAQGDNAFPANTAVALQMVFAEVTTALANAMQNDGTVATALNKGQQDMMTESDVITTELTDATNLMNSVTEGISIAAGVAGIAGTVAMVGSMYTAASGPALSATGQAVLSGTTGVASLLSGLAGAGAGVATMVRGDIEGGAFGSTKSNIAYYNGSLVKAKGEQQALGSEGSVVTGWVGDSASTVSKMTGSVAGDLEAVSEGLASSSQQIRNALKHSL